MAKKKTEFTCTNYAEIDGDTVLLTVLKRTITKSFFREIETDEEEIYVGLISDRIWIGDGSHIVPTGSDLSVRLWEFAVNHLANKRLDRFSATL